MFPYQKYIRENDYVDVAFNKVKNIDLKKIINYNKFKYTHTIEKIIKKYSLNNFAIESFYFDFSNDPYTNKYSTISLSDIFNEKARMKAHIKNKISPYDFFIKNKKKLLNEAKEITNKKKKYNFIREKIYELHPYECTPFRPDLYTAIIKLFSLILNNKKLKILDPSSGWGDRLIGFLASDCADEYYSTDPNEKLLKGYAEIYNKLDNKKKYVLMIPRPFEGVEFYENYYDIVCTSPPFFDYEIYSDTNKNQSTNKYTDEKKWFDNFLDVLMINSTKYLKNNGYLILHISQHENHNYLYWLLDKKYDNLSFCGIIGCAGESKRIHPLFIWKKNEKCTQISIKKLIP